MVHIVGAGPGAVDLITVRGRKYIEEADVIIYAGSLVNRELLSWAKEGAACYDSASMTLEEVMDVIRDAEEKMLTTVRLHTGDPSIYGAVREQMDQMDAMRIPYDICPGVSSFCGAAAALEMEYTLPGISQSVVITRLAGRTPVPERETIASFAAHQATMVVFLSAGMPEKLSAQLIEGGYGPDTPAAIVYKATWPEQKTVRCTVGTLAETAAKEGICKTALIVVGNTVAQKGYDRSKLYDPDFTTGFRERKKEGPGTLYVVGMGPGSLEQMTGQAREALEQCQVIAGYTVYVELIRRYFPDKTYLTTAMTREEERCRRALDCCMEGKDTALVCSGDAGVYGMAGLVLELSQEYPSVEIKVISGVTAATAGAAVLGAPLMHDFAVISLSDRLTDLETIWNRIEKAAAADFVICLYNPASKGRPDYLRQACERIMKYRPPETVCGLVSRIGREGEEKKILSLRELAGYPADMFTTVFIGNSDTRQIGSFMVTPRGYRI
ncbi:MAG: precorrin-4 C(11)-methyltransferase [Enterocloster sp.]